MKLRVAITSLLFILAAHSSLVAQPILYWKTDGSSGTWTSNNWGTTAGGPFTSGWTSGADAVFNANSSITNVSNTPVSNITVANGTTVTLTAAGTFGLGGAVRTFDIGAGATLTWNGQNISTAAGTGVIKNGAGTWDIGGQGNLFPAGLTLNNGTIILGGNNAMGGGTFTVNGGIINSTSARTFNATVPMVIGGDFALSGSAIATFAMPTSLGASTRTITNSLTSGTRTFSGVISGGAGAGLTIAGTGSGQIFFSNAANTYSGPITINGGDLGFVNEGSFGNTSSITIDGGRLVASTASGAGVTYTINSSRNIFVGASAGTAISIGGTGTITYDGAIADKPTTTGILTKQGSGTLVLGGVSTYSGNTTINQGILRLSNGNDRLPTGAAVSFGQAGSTFVGALDLNGFNQEVAGLNSITGTNATSARNIVTSASAATLTLSGAGNYSFSDTTPQNSGNLTGSLSLVKNGSGTQQFSGDHTYTGTTTINSGIIAMNGSHIGGGTYTINGGSLQGSGNIVANVSVAGGALSPGNGPGVLNVGGNVTFSSTSSFNIDLNGASSYDQLNVTGAFRSVTLGNSILNLNVAFSPLPSNMFFIVNNDDASSILSGRFAGLPNNGDSFTLGGYTGQISYVGDSSNLSLTGGNDVVLYNLVAAIPEPGTIVLVGLTGIGVLHWHFRRKSKQKAEAAQLIDIAEL